MKRFSGAAIVLGLLGLAAALVLWWMPANDFLLVPDRAKPLADRVEVDGGKTNAKGDVYYVDLFVRRIRRLEQLLPFTRPDGATVVPERAIAPEGTSDAERDRQNAADMDRSEQIASVVALRALGYHVVATPRGVLVTSVSGDVPAAKELKPDDVIVAVDGVPVSTPAQLRREVGRHEPGDDLRLTLHRGDKVKDVTVRTIASPVDSSRAIIGILVDQDAKIQLPVPRGHRSRSRRRPVRGAAVRARDRPSAREGRHPWLPDRRHGRARARRQRPADRRHQAEDDRSAPGRCGFLPGAGRGERRGSARQRRGLHIIPVDSFQQALRELATKEIKC